MAKHSTHKERKKGDGRFIRVFHHMLNTEAGQSLTPPELAVLIRVMQIYNGENNGRIAMSGRRAGELANINKNTAAKCLRALIEKGFLIVTRPSSFGTNGTKATCYEITCFPMGKRTPPKNSFQQWKPYSEKNIVVLNQGHERMKLGPQCMKSRPVDAASV